MKQIKEDYDLDYLYVDASKLSKKDQKEILKVLDIEGSTPTIAVVAIIANINEKSRFASWGEKNSLFVPKSTRGGIHDYGI